MTEWIEVGPGFWNLRGSFTVLLGAVDIGTHASLIKLPSGKFLLIDTIAFSDKAIRELNELTDNGKLIEAVLATHPFHTVYFATFFKLYPDLTYYGCPRHLTRGDGVNWSKTTLLEEGLRKQWEDQGVFMRIPDGADFEAPEESNHFSSVLVFHAPSKTIHVDDTVMFFEKPGFVLRMAGKADGTMEFWDLKKGLQKTEAAPLAFKAWVEALLNDWDFDNIVTAHTGNKLGGAKQFLADTLRKATPALEKLSQKAHVHGADCKH